MTTQTAHGVSTTSQAMQDIAQTEAQARERIEQARALMAEEEAASLRREDERLQEGKRQMKEVHDAAMHEEQRTAEETLAKGLQAVEKEKDALRGTYEQKKASVATKLIQQFFSEAA